MSCYRRLKKTKQLLAPRYSSEAVIGDCKGCQYDREDGSCDYAARKADYLLANGVIVPPCKVGDKVYCIVEGFDVVMEGHVRQFIVAEGMFIDCVIRGYFNQVFHSSNMGKTVFLTKEEAEQALKGGGE